MNISVAFLINSPWIGKRPSLTRPSLTNNHRIYRIKQTTKASSIEEGNPNKPKSKTLKIAEMLGQSEQSMKQKQEKVYEEEKRTNREKYTAAFISTAAAVGLFLFQKVDPQGPKNLLHFLQQSSEPVSIVGTNNKPSVVEFTADWCETCKAMARDVFELKKEYSNRVNFVVIDSEKVESQEIIEQFGVDGIPQFSLINKNGVVQGNLIGNTPREVLIRDLNALIEEQKLPFPGLSLRDLMPPEY